MDTTGERHYDNQKTTHLYPRTKSCSLRGTAVAVRIVQQSGKSVTQVAREMDLTDSALRLWVKQAQVDQNTNAQGPLTTAERQELVHLRRELKRIEMERDFLKKAAAFFARENPIS